MTDRMIQKTVRLEPEIAQRIESDAEARGVSFSAVCNEYILSSLDGERLTAVVGELVAPLSGEILAKRDDRKFGHETPLQELRRRTTFLQLLVIQMMAESLGPEKAREVAQRAFDDLRIVRDQ